MAWDPEDSEVFLSGKEGQEYIVVRGMARRRAREQEELAKLPRACAGCGADIWSTCRTFCPPCVQKRGIRP